MSLGSFLADRDDRNEVIGIPGILLDACKFWIKWGEKGQGSQGSTQQGPNPARLEVLGSPEYARLAGSRFSTSHCAYTMAFTRLGGGEEN